MSSKHNFQVGRLRLLNVHRLCSKHLLIISLKIWSDGYGFVSMEEPQHETGPVGTLTVYTSLSGSTLPPACLDLSETCIPYMFTGNTQFSICVDSTFCTAFKNLLISIRHLKLPSIDDKAFSCFLADVGFFVHFSSKKNRFLSRDSD